ncbi:MULTISPECIES: ATP-dependent DNA helicase RecG [Bacillota]|jgi:ATP-dependent DNA helicase RecG|uniref:ATP-dependent DNA helicase RecG n=1 Tax=Amedibacillus hominis TaxID=2897776 RepID=A0ABS9R5B5_9FIRM|nr:MULTISPECIES: ATP-dependent DNA helicase RecG [Bacillota]MCH4284836.1 ATP-dependent DNA helicase RecG [Amedibacillus hominis]RGB55060.1 ATP-dependent DNA helicase RecG [Absiella sp. AM22-9]RGB62650.1 ATP-dependent DNA helicase RecG [Absiella sp. AM10-20]RGB69534.1 ATP-dependent DNA helicase RecG [Absiella sp. AM09-45]RGB77698.1 ATP-dependent DNA helicase RecG [Absiella sp. AM09-50]
MELKALRISDKKIEILNNMNIFQAEDLLTYYPFRYEVSEFIPRKDWQKDMKISMEAMIITHAKVIRFRGKQSITRFKVVFEEEEFDVSIFNRPWVSAFEVGKTISIFGKYEGGSRITAMTYNFKPLKEQLGIFPVYNIREGITQKDIIKYIEKAWNVLQDQVEDFLPKDILEKYRLIPKKQALYFIHHPGKSEALRQSLRHLKYEEFFKFQLAMQAIKSQEKEVVKGCEKHFDVEDVMELKNSLTFSLTDDQEKVIEEILEDLASEKVMYRMVQGDVGCGKTLVAAFGLYACVLSHKQAAFLAPTEILAKQHYKNLLETFKDVDVQIDVLYSSLKPADKKAVLQRLKNNETDILVGTHALFQDDVDFHDLGMVVADEQHRFGVSQRRKMLEKGDKVDFLFMSATPIPRTLAISLYGDMDVSTIQHLPKGRMPITTKLVKSRSMGPILEEVLEKIDEGNQCYVVCPAIEKNEDYDIKNVNDIYDGMKKTIGRMYSIGLLHGKMNTQEKDAVMQDFVDGKIQILISTTVIEVGVDVKNANIMVIYDANRFGLSQIHQLRGRVGRGQKPGYCYLLSNTSDPDTMKRLKICEKTSDGFEIAREDLKLRGPGDILGTRQSGVPGFILGDVIQDANILEVARDDAAYVLKHMEEDRYTSLKSYINDTLSSGTYLD